MQNVFRATPAVWFSEFEKISVTMHGVRLSKSNSVTPGRFLLSKSDFGKPEPILQAPCRFQYSLYIQAEFAEFAGINLN